MSELPCVLANGRLPDLFEKIAAAAKPEKFTQDTLEKLGFTSSNDRNFTPLLRKMGFLTDANNPTARYDYLRDPTHKGQAIAEGIRDACSEIFQINTSINTTSPQEIKGAIARTTGYPESTVDRVYSTFTALCKLANFSGASRAAMARAHVISVNKEADNKKEDDNVIKRQTTFHYNIQIHLPATTDISVYNAIFKSLKENLEI